jgi:hypothetical protein
MILDFEYWQKQGKTPLFPEVDSWPPEQKRFAGKLLLIGGNKGSFFAVANAMQMAVKRGVGEVRVVMPKSLKGKVPSMPEIIFAEAEASGAFGKLALSEILLQAAWADAVVVVGELGRNAETSVMMAEFLKICDKPIYLMRDAVDAAAADVMNWSLNETPVTLLATVPQLQKLLRIMYYPKMITLSMPTNQLVETLHKFTLSFAMTVMTFHNEQIIMAQNGEVITASMHDTGFTPINLWDGKAVVDTAILQLWNPAQDTLKCMATSVVLE